MILANPRKQGVQLKFMSEKGAGIRGFSLFIITCRKINPEKLQFVACHYPNSVMATTPKNITDAPIRR